jgi:endonuclease/exonuclease/phosphatase (EEP) superfamily protein YafD
MKILLSFLAILACQVAFAVLIPTDNQVLLNLGSPSTKTIPEKHLQVLVWNLHKGGDQDFEKDFALLTVGKDLILSQEILLTPKMKKVFSDLPDYLFSTATSFFVGSDLERTGVAIAAKAPSLNTLFIRTVNHEPFLDSPKMTIINQYPIRNRNDYLTVINLHGINFVTAQTFNEEINRVCRVIIALKLINHPLILAGDFNSWSEERLSILNRIKNNLGLNEANFLPDNRITFNNHPLDHVFYSKHLTLVSAKAEGFYQGSDHKPLELIFDIQSI